MRRAAIFLGIPLLLILAAAFAVHRYIDADHFRPMLESGLSTALARTVTIGSLNLSLASGTITASGITVSDDPSFGAEPFLRAGSLRVGVELQPLVFSRELNITSVQIDQPEIRFLRDRSGQPNYATLGRPSPPAPAAARTPATATDPPAQSSFPKMKIDSVLIKDGRVSFPAPENAAKPMVLNKVNLELKGITMTSEVPFTLSANLSDDETIELTGTAGPLDQLNPANTPFTADAHIAKIDLRKTGFFDSARGIDGVAMLNANIVEKDGIAYLKGRAAIAKLKLVSNGVPINRLVDVDFTLQHDSRQRAGKLTRCSVGIGHAVTNLVGRYDLGGVSPVIHAQLAGQEMELADLSALLPALGIALPKGVDLDQGTAFVDLSADGALDKLVVAGKFGIANARLANYDLAAKLKVLSAIAGVKLSRDTDMQLFSANIRMTPMGAALDAIHVVVPTIGDITGSGSVSPDRSLGFKLRLAVRRQPGTVPTAAALGAIPFWVEGTSDDPRFHPDVRAFASDKAQLVTKGAATAEGRIKSLVRPGSKSGAATPRPKR